MELENAIKNNSKQLNQLGNNFLDRHPKDKQKILRYLKNYNFQISVNAFTPLLWNNLNDGIEEKNCILFIIFNLMI